ncbi:non-hydrolyzing UDP-N-acetylglucosamine 2-epimerase [Seonamhaeicola marinus]|uniref:UDP-N-acetylglucosamine 2-epimerase (Non-hydrolyzing) n=1 Tax=Seonamhaeicola marinus TaxID=1912246 RepID=A0A5D0HJF4_9FLAO|nr:UDP-N-acetylglucosamine 2-epimerase (non-hydrolyzing) [Seonamhaeicola marinus]TYA71418.1 UDP-N-acetylglucosamine 2-epimerase (non-hydrolyzing) [Seonamhaeicola marinus]
MNIDIIAGARPNFIKIAPIIDAIKSKKADGYEINYRLIHTGQHYDKNMSLQFFEELNIPKPDLNFEVGSGSQASQTAAIMISYENLLKTEKPDLCLVVGDVNSTMACAIVAKKAQVKVIHVEAGIRSGDLAMPEEINRIVTDSLTDYYFTTTKTASENLIKEGINESNIYFVGNVMIDTLNKFMSSFKPPKVWADLNLQEKSYVLLTMHRPSNVDAENSLKAIIDTVCENSNGLPVVFPVHPRTLKTLNQLNINYDRLYTIPPLGYLEFNYLTKYAKVVITDSGGITEETTVMGVPCITVRNSTERPETVTIGTNELVGTKSERIKLYLNKLFNEGWKEGKIPEKWDGKSAKRIVDILISNMS